MKKRTILPVTAALIISAVSCGQSAQQKTAAEQPESLEISEESQNSGYLKIVGDSVEIPSFEIALKLSEKAEEKLKADTESVVVIAYFSGKAIADIPEKYADMADYGFNFLTCKIELTDERVARFEHIKFSKELYDLLADKDITLLINVVSGRKSSEYNILDCETLENSMSNVMGKRFTLNGTLIEIDN